MSETRQSHGFPLTVAVHTDVGRVRSNNEDSFGKAWLDDGSLFVMVADGMGGHEAGEVASGLAVRVVEEVVGRDPDADPRGRLYGGLLEANEAILEEGRRSGTRGMGTTAIAGVFRGREVYVGQVGDSRIYHIRRGQLVWRTMDHTRVQMLLEQGQIDEEQARTHPESGMLTRALGHSRMADGRPLAPEVLAEPLVMQDQDALEFCSDGLHDLLEDHEVGEVIAGHEPADAARALVELACERGGHDNVTVAVVVAGDRASELDESFVPETWARAETTADVEVSSSYDSELGMDEDSPTEALPAVAETTPSPVPVSETGIRSGPNQLPPPGPRSIPGKEPPRARMLFGVAAVSAVAIAAAVVIGLILIGGAFAWYYL
jgi:protein phosphatase